MAGASEDARTPHTAGKRLLVPGPGSPQSSCPGRAGMVSGEEGWLRVFGRTVAMGDLWDQSSQIFSLFQRSCKSGFFCEIF